MHKKILKDFWQYQGRLISIFIIPLIFLTIFISPNLTLSILTPFRLPCTPFVDYAHLSIDNENTSGDYANLYVIILCVVLYENNTVDRCSSQYVLFSLTIRSTVFEVPC